MREWKLFQNSSVTLKTLLHHIITAHLRQFQPDQGIILDTKMLFLYHNFNIGCNIIIIYKKKIAKFANLRTILRENCELFRNLLGVMSIRCYFVRVTNYFLRQWTCIYVVYRHLFFIHLITWFPSPYITQTCRRSVWSAQESSWNQFCKTYVHRFTNNSIA